MSKIWALLFYRGGGWEGGGQEGFWKLNIKTLRYKGGEFQLWTLLLISDMIFNGFELSLLIFFG